jgi:hypothetical protein
VTPQLSVAHFVVDDEISVCDDEPVCDDKKVCDSYCVPVLYFSCIIDSLRNNSTKIDDLFPGIITLAPR